MEAFPCSLSWMPLETLKVSRQECGMTQVCVMEDEFGSSWLCSHVQRGWAREEIIKKQMLWLRNRELVLQLLYM